MKYLLLCLLILSGILWMFFGEDMIAEYEYWRTLRKISSRTYIPSVLDSSFAEYIHLPSIEMSLSSREIHSFDTLIRSWGFRDRILDKVNGDAQSPDQLRTRAFLLHVLAMRLPGDDLLKPIKHSLRSSDRSIYGWACTDLDYLVDDAFLDRADQSELRVIQRLLDIGSIDQLEESDFVDGFFLKDEFEDARESVLRAITEKLEEVTDVGKGGKGNTAP